jgi:hypothetical protein
MDREALLEPVISSIRAGTALSRFAILEYFKDWDVVPYYEAGQHACTAVVKGTEIHFAVMPDFKRKVIRRKNTRAFLAPLFERQGYLTTRVPHGRLAQKEFVQRIGFKPTWQDSEVEYFLLGSLPFERKS